MSDKKCPRCGLWSTPSAINCDCGYFFEKAGVPESSYWTRFLDNKQKTDTTLGILTVIYSLAILPTCLLFPFTLINCWDSCVPITTTFYTLVIIFPFVVAGSVISARSTLKDRKLGLAILLGIFPSLYFLMLLAMFSFISRHSSFAVMN